jgi:hypothetical protein
MSLSTTTQQVNNAIGIASIGSNNTAIGSIAIGSNNTITGNSFFGNSITTTGNSNVTYNNTTGTINSVITNTTYHVLGEDIEVNGYKDTMTILALCSITLLGKPYYDELVKNGVNMPKEIEDFLRVKFRDDKINQILNH